MANVNEAMKKHAAEQAARQAAGQPAPAVPWGSPQAAPSIAGRPLRLPLGPCARNLVVHYDRAGGIAEEYRALRNALLSHFREKRFCLLVTSAEPREGTTVTCLNLALALAEDRDRRTIVVDCNLRRGRVAALLRTAPGPGVADVLRGAATLPDATWGTGYPNLYAIPAGRASAHEVIPLFQRPTLDDLVADLRRRFDYILLDSPPVRVVPDVGYLGRVAPHALLVVRLHKTPRHHISQALALLHAANIAPLGLALTHRQ